MKCTMCHFIYFFYLFFICLTVLKQKKYWVNKNEREEKRKSQTGMKKLFLSGCRLWVWVLICQLLHFSHPSIPPSISFLFWCYLPPSCSYQFISPHISLLTPPLPTLLFSYIHLSKCVCICMCVPIYLCRKRYLPGQWWEEKTVCIISYS